MSQPQIEKYNLKDIPIQHTLSCRFKEATSFEVRFTTMVKGKLYISIPSFVLSDGMWMFKNARNMELEVGKVFPWQAFVNRLKNSKGNTYFGRGFKVENSSFSKYTSYTLASLNLFKISK